MRHVLVELLIAAAGDPTTQPATSATSVPVINTANWRVFIAVAVSVIMTILGLGMTMRARQNSVRKQADTALSALIGITVIAGGLAAGVLLAWGGSIITFFGQG